MAKEKDEILLFIITDRGNIAIPFKNLLEVDSYTIRFENILELLKKIGKIVKKDLSSLRVIDSYLEYNYNYRATRENVDLNGKLPIKYKDDNYDDDNLITGFAEYLKGDYQRIKQFNIKFVRVPAIENYIRGNGILTDEDIDMAVNAYFKDGNYKKRREVYFKLKRFGKKIRINKYREDKVSGNGDLSKFEINDEYLSSLADYARKGEEEYQNVMEIISLYDIDDISKKMKNPHYGVIDGMTDYDQVFSSDIVALEMATGISIQDLEKIINGSIKERRKR